MLLSIKCMIMLLFIYEKKRKYMQTKYYTPILTIKKIYVVLMLIND